jgi:toxin HigB-1
METGNASGMPAAATVKIHDMLSFLQDMATVDELHAIPSWKTHQLAGDRKGTWALHVTKNWRMTFQIDHAEIEIIDLDYEDYH